MNRRYLALISRIEDELSEIERLVKRITNGWESGIKTGDNLYLDSVALNLHGFYSAIERIFELIAKDIDGSLPEGTSWHQDLLIQMKTELKKVRPSIISRETYKRLDEYRGFRHVVRNVYTYNLSSKRIEPLVEEIESLFVDIKKELMSFINLLEDESTT